MNRILTLLPVTLLAVCLASTAFTQQPTATAPSKTIIHAAHLLDVKTGKMMDNVSVTVEGGKITAITPGAPPAGANVFQLPNSTLVPGLIDAPTHHTFDPNFC
jgi:imidazolonepropionase-like amidohydrolase